MFLRKRIDRQEIYLIFTSLSEAFLQFDFFVKKNGIRITHMLCLLLKRLQVELMHSLSGDNWFFSEQKL